MSSWLYRLDYFDLYNKYLQHTTHLPNLIESIESIELIKLQNDIIIDKIQIVEIVETEHKILNKLNILKIHSKYINKILDKQNKNFEMLQDNISHIVMPIIKLDK